MSELFDFVKSAALDAASKAAPAAAPAAGGIGSFVEQNLPLAQKVSEKTGVAPEVLLGQWGLETGWGKSVIPGSNNLGNIKAGVSWRGATVSAVDNQTKTSDPYRKYNSADEFGDDYTELLNRRYASALNTGNDSLSFFTNMKRNGYAEDKDYVQKGVNATNAVARSMGKGANGLPGQATQQAPGQFASPQGRNYVTPRPDKQSATLGDYAKQLAASALDAFGYAGQALGEAGAGVANAVTGTEDYESKNLAKFVTDPIRESMTEGGKQAMQESQVKGDLSDPSTWELPSTAQGYGMLAVNGLGSLATMLLPVVGVGARVSSLAKSMEVAKAAGDLAKAGTIAKELKAAQSTMTTLGAATNAAVTGGDRKSVV